MLDWGPPLRSHVRLLASLKTLFPAMAYAVRCWELRLYHMNLGGHISFHRNSLWGNTLSKCCCQSQKVRDLVSPMAVPLGMQPNFSK